MNIIKFTKVALGEHFGLALTTTGKVYQWGAINASTQLEIHKIDINNVKDIYCGSHHAFVITNNDEVYGWGCNNFCQLTAKAAFFQETPIKIDIENVLSIACGKYHSIFLHSTGEVDVVGNNLYGQLGLADKICRSELTMMGLTNVKSIASGQFHSLFVTNHGNLYACGYNNVGQLGLKHFYDFYNHDFPRRVDLNNVINVYCGGLNSFCETADNCFYSWGYNNEDELGIFVKGNTHTPTMMGFNIKNIVAGAYHTFVVSGSRTVPLTGFISIAVAGTFSAMISDSGDLYTWGYPAGCQLGYKIEQAFVRNPELRIVFDRDVVDLTPE